MSAGKVLRAQVRPSTTKNVLATLTVGLTVAFAVGFFAIFYFKFPVDPTIREAHVRVFSIQATHAQVGLYMALIGLVALICVTALLRPGMKFFSTIGSENRALPFVIFITAILLGSASNPKGFPLGFLLIAALVYFQPKDWFTNISKAWRPLNVDSFQRSSNLLFWVAAGMVIIFLGVFLFLPFFTPRVIHGASELAFFELHYAMTVLPGFDFICCTDVGTIERANYGIGMSMLTTLALKALSLGGIANPTLVYVVKLYQIVAVVMIWILSFTVNRKASLYVVALALGITAYMLTNISNAVSAPNQSGIRYISFLAALLVLVLEIRRAHSRAWLLGSAAAIFVLLSPETGLATSSGYMVALALKGYDPTSPISSIAKVVTRFGVTFVATIIVGFILISGLISNISTGGLLEFVSLFVGGYGGLSKKPNISVILLFFFASGALLRGVWRARDGNLTWVDIYQASVGTVMLVWLMYYMNRMHYLNLWFQLVLFMLMIAPRLSPGCMRLLFWQSSKRLVTYPLIIASLIGGQLVHSSYKLLSQTTEWMQTDYSDCVILNGMCLKGALGGQISKKMKTLKARFSPRETLVLSSLSSSVRLQGFNEGFPWYEPFGEVIRNRDVDLLVDWIERRGPKYLLVDDSTSLIGQASIHNNFADVLARLGSYRKTGTDTGWAILERLSDVPAESRNTLSSNIRSCSIQNGFQQSIAQQSNDLRVENEQI